MTNCVKAPLYVVMALLASLPAGITVGVDVAAFDAHVLVRAEEEVLPLAIWGWSLSDLLCCIHKVCYTGNYDLQEH